MKTRYLLALLCAVLWSSVVHAQGFPTLPPVPKTPQLADDPTQTIFTFIAAGDNRPANSKSPQPATLSQLLKDSKQHNPTFIIWSGDTIAGFRTAGQPMHKPTLEKQYKKFFKIAATAGVPIFNTPGNHEMDVISHPSKNENVETPDDKMQALYLKMMEYPANAPAYGAFNYGNSRFIAVDTEEVPPITAVRSEGETVAKKLKLDPGFVSPQQIELLTADLEANKTKAHIFVFMHHPIQPLKKSMRLNKENADVLEKLFANYPNVSYVIAAHEHLYFNAGGGKGAPIYVVSGGAGAPLGKCPKHAGKNCSDSHHYLVFKVNGSSVTMKMVKLKS